MIVDGGILIIRITSMPEKASRQKDFIPSRKYACGRLFMNLIEVVDLLKEMIDNCESLDGDDFLIAPSKVPNSSVEGYEIHMTGKFDEPAREYLNQVALKKKLAIVQHPDSVMIYKTKSKIELPKK